MDSRSPTVALVSAAIAGGIVGVSIGYLISRKQAIQNTEQSAQTPEKKIQHHSEAEDNLVRVTEEEDTLLWEQCKRNIQFLGEDEFRILRKARVVIVGVGGTGSHAASLLARSGIGHLRLIDLDQVSLSSLNRHAVATRADVGTSKVLAMKRHLLKIVPDLKCETVQDIFTQDNGRRLLLSADPLNEEEQQEIIPDFVVDCIDNVETKAFLLALCHQNNINVITTCGAGCRADPTRFTICDINEAVGDPLLRSTKTLLNKKYKIKGGINCLFSTERPPRKLLPFVEAEAEEDPLDYQTLPEIHMRVRIVPVIGPMPAIWGNAIAMYVIIKLSGLEFNPSPVEARGRKFWDGFLTRLRRSETKHTATDILKLPVKLTHDDVKFVVEDLWNCESVLSGKVPVSSLTCVRLNKEEPISFRNMIPMTDAEAKRYYETENFWAAHTNAKNRIDIKMSAANLHETGEQ